MIVLHTIKFTRKEIHEFLFCNFNEIFPINFAKQNLQIFAKICVAKLNVGDFSVSKIKKEFQFKLNFMNFV